MRLIMGLALTISRAISRKQKILQQIGMCSYRPVESNFWKHLDDASLLFELDASVYSTAACLRAAHEMSSKYAINIKAAGVKIILTVVSTGTQELGAFDVGLILRTVTDYALRERLNAETARTRNAILAAAFGGAKLPIREHSGEN
jgi:His-Xaa-Ser system protein HxsD